MITEEATILEENEGTEHTEQTKRKKRLGHLNFAPLGHSKTHEFPSDCYYVHITKKRTLFCAKQ